MKKLLTDTTPSRAARYDSEEGCEHFPEMRARLRETANRILEGDIRIEYTDHQRLLGIETETSCIGVNGETFTQAKRDQLVQARSGRDYELGAHQIELQMNPFDIQNPEGFEGLWEEMQAEDAHLTRDLAQMSAVQVRLGADPARFLDESIRTQGVARYHIVPNFHERFRRKDWHGLWSTHPYVVGALSSVQFNLDCHSIEEAIDLLNRSFVTNAYVVAMSANARYLNGEHTGYADVRGVVWERTHDLRNKEEERGKLGGRIGLPSNYYTSLFDYFLDVHDQPTILPREVFEGEKGAEPFNVGTRLLWRDTRLKFLPTNADGSERKIVLEFRPMSVQPTAFGDYAMVLFGLGHLFGSYIQQTPLMPFETMRANRDMAMLNGMSTNLWYHDGSGLTIDSATQALKRESEVAIAGLTFLGCPLSLVNLATEEWNTRLRDGSPSEVMTRKAMTYIGKNYPNAKVDHELLRMYLENGHSFDRGAT